MLRIRGTGESSFSTESLFAFFAEGFFAFFADFVGFDEDADDDDDDDDDSEDDNVDDDDVLKSLSTGAIR